MRRRRYLKTLQFHLRAALSRNPAIPRCVSFRTRLFFCIHRFVCNAALAPFPRSPLNSPFIPLMSERSYLVSSFWISPARFVIDAFHTYVSRRARLRVEVTRLIIVVYYFSNIVYCFLFLLDQTQRDVNEKRRDHTRIDEHLSLYFHAAFCACKHTWLYVFCGCKQIEVGLTDVSCNSGLVLATWLSLRLLSSCVIRRVSFRLSIFHL